MKKLIFILLLFVGCDTHSVEPSAQKLHTLKISINKEIHLLQVINSDIITKKQKYHIIAHTKHPSTIIANFTYHKPDTLKLYEIVEYID